MISVKNLSKTYKDGYVAFENVSFDVNEGDVLAIIGPSGTGKSTLLRMLNGLEKPTSGEVIVDGVSMYCKNINRDAIRRKIVMVAQNVELFNHLNVIDNITLGPTILLGEDKDKASEEAMKYLRMVGLGEKAKMYPEQLSGGQKQRVAIARCLAMKPEVILFDEPTSALDSAMVTEVLAVIRDLAKKGLTMMIVTHELKFLKDVCSRAIFLEDKGIYEEGTPEQIFTNPQKAKTKIFVKGIKGISFDANSADYDLYELNAEIEWFCSKYGLAQKYITMELMVEELLMSIFPSPYSVHISIEYVEQSSEVKISLSRVEDAGAILEGVEEDDLSLTIIKGFCNDIKEYTDNGVRTVDLYLK